MSRRNDISWIDPTCGTGDLLIESARHLSTYSRLESARFQAIVSNYEWIPISEKMQLIRYSMLVNFLQFRIASLREFSRASQIEMFLENSSPNINLWTIDEQIEYFEVVEDGAEETETVRTDFRLLMNYDLLTVDTIHLSIPIHHLRIAPEHQLEIKNNPCRNQILWSDEQGNVVIGSQAKWRGNGIYLKIGKLKRGYIEGNTVGCIIQLSVPGIYGHEDNLMALDHRVTKGVFEAVEQKLREIGVHTDLKAAKIVRCDLNRNIALDEPFENYMPVLRLLNFPRTQKDVYEEKKTGAMWRNKSQSIKVYDKLAQIERLNKKRRKQKKREFSTKGLPPTARFEWQIKGAVNVQAKLGVHSVNDLLERWETLPALFQKCKNSLFSHDLEALQIPRPRSDRNGQSPIQKEIQNLLRWCGKNQIEIGTEEQLQILVLKRGVEAYARKVKALPNMDQKHANTSIRRMRTALLREATRTRSDFMRRHDELNYKLEGNWLVMLNKALWLVNLVSLKNESIGSGSASDTSTMECYHCGSSRVNKSGQTKNGKQRYRCRNCKRTLRESPQRQEHSQTFKAEVLRACREGTSRRGLTRTFGVSRQTVTAWLKKAEALSSC